MEEDMICDVSTSEREPDYIPPSAQNRWVAIGYMETTVREHSRDHDDDRWKACCLELLIKLDRLKWDAPHTTFARPTTT